MTTVKAFDNQSKIEDISRVPKHPFCCQVQGTRAAGKTTLILNMLTNANLLGKTFHRVFWISPSSKLDDKIRGTLAKCTDTVIIHNTLLENAVKAELKKEEQNQKFKTRGHVNIPMTDLNHPQSKPEGTWKDFKLPKADMNDPQWYPKSISISFLKQLMAEQDAIITKFGKDKANKVLLIFDDCLGSNILKANEFKKLCSTNRHHYISCLFSLQNLRSLPKEYRVLCDSLVLFQTGNKKEIGIFYEENTCFLSFDEWFEIYRYCTEEDYSFMTILYRNPRVYRIEKQFSEFIDLGQFKT